MVRDVELDRLRGYNTDAGGLIHPVRKIMKSFVDKEVAIIGAGGVARAAIWAMQRYGARVTLFARNVTSAAPLAQLFNISSKPLSSASFAGYDLVINATPLGSQGHLDQSPATQQQLKGARCVYDLVYNPVETRLLREAGEAGCRAVGGLQMLVAQARFQFELWTGKKFSSSWIMHEAARTALRG